MNTIRTKKNQSDSKKKRVVENAHKKVQLLGEKIF